MRSALSTSEAAVGQGAPFIVKKTSEEHEMKHNTMILTALLFALCVFVGLGCGEKVPIQEMSAAKVEVSKAASVQADRYAPEEMKAARNGLMESHTQVAKGDVSDASGTANKAKAKAEEAYNKSVPLLARDSIETAEKSFESATEAYAENLARDEYLKAQSGIKDANDQFQNKQFYNAHLKAVAADEDAKKARDISLGKKGVLSDSITDVNVTIDRARNYNAEKHAGDNLRLAEENVKIANDSLGTLKLKQGFSAVEVAKMNADEALAKSMRGTSSDKIGDAKVLLGQAEKSPGASSATTDLAMARESLNSSERLHSDAKYPEAITAAEDSQRLSRLVLATKADTRVDLSTQGKDKDKAATTERKSQTQIDCERGYALYTVRYIPGNKDCLWRIARIYYGDGFKWPKIHDANRDQVSNPHLILPGQQLKVPMDGSVTRCRKYITSGEGDGCASKDAKKSATKDAKKSSAQEGKAGYGEGNGGGARVEEPEY